MKIPAFIINVEKRNDRKTHIINEIGNKPEFLVVLVKAIEHKSGALGLWMTILEIIKGAVKNNDEFIIICEDDHQFTERYNFTKMKKLILEAGKRQADILLGGVSWYKTAVQISENLFWVDQFSGLQFTVVYRKFFKSILNAKFGDGDASDYKISALSNNKLIMHPFISIQKEFGYSDVTSRNNELGYISRIFKKSSMGLNQLKRVKEFYKKLPKLDLILTEEQYNEMLLPVYLMNLTGTEDRSNYTKEQFDSRDEFEVNILENCGEEIDALSLWKIIINVINSAVRAEEHFVIFCKEHHEFTDAYSKKFLIENIIEAHTQGADILFGNASSFAQIVPITATRYWVNHVGNSSFFVIYEKMFQKILNYQFRRKDELFQVFSSMSSNKMLLYPFIFYLDEKALAVDGALDYVDRELLNGIGDLKRLKEVYRIVKNYGITTNEK